jgi:uncharacterized protein (UPF0332 family)
MNARFEALEQEGKTERVPTGRAEVDRLHAVVARDLATAEDLRERNRDWALAIAYNAMLQACLALMAACGYRPRGEAQHKTAIAFARLALPEHDRLLDRVDRLRHRRHQAAYGAAGQISATDVETALALAREILPVLRGAAVRRLEAEEEGRVQ